MDVRITFKSTLLCSALASASYLATGAFMAQPLHAEPSTAAAELMQAADTAAGTAGAKSAPVCDGVTNDRVALQALLDAGYDPVSGKYEPIVVTIPVTPEGCVTDGKLVVHSNTRVVQDGLLSLKGYVHTSVTQWGVYTIADNSQNVVIEGAGTIDVNRAAHDPNACCIGGIVTGGPEIGDYSANVKNITLRGLRIINAINWPVSVDGATNVKVQSMTATDGRNSFQIGHNSRNVSADNLHISNITDVGFCFYRGVQNATLSNSVVSNASGSAIGVFTDSPANVPPGIPSSNITITGNVVSESNAGIDVNGLDAPDSSNINITGNVAHHNRIGGIGMTACKNCLISSNLIHDSGAEGVNYATGIYLSHVQGLLVTGNTVFNEGQHSTTGLGLAVTDWYAGRPASSRLTITGNNFYDDQATKTMAAALAGGTANPTSSTGNTLGPMIGTRDIFGYGTGSIINNNAIP